jgi:hypothetical protein
MGASKGTPMSRSQTRPSSEDREERRQIKPSVDDFREERRQIKPSIYDFREARQESREQGRTFAKRKAREVIERKTREVIERKKRTDSSAPEQDSQEPRSPRRGMIEGGRAERLFERSSQRKNQESIGPYG